MTAGKLSVVATPIGHLGDLSPRAVDVLRSADVIACEDTRRTRKLLTHAGITGPRLVAVHDRNEASRAGQLADLVSAGRRVALVTDAGTPAISDPGERVVTAMVKRGLAVEVVPGPAAMVAALVVSGLPTGRFCFEGFLPRKGAERRRRLGQIAEDERTVVLYEAPHRLAETLGDLAAACGPLRRVVLARELTKVHEEVWRASLGEAVQRAAQVEPRGEYVIVLDGAPAAAPATDADVEDALRSELAGGADPKTAVTTVARALGVPRRRVYDLSLPLR